MKDYIQINPLDNVFVTLTDLKSAHTIDDLNISIQQDVSAGHKVALKDIKQGENIIKYGCPIGYAKSDIKQGEHVHVHNISTNLSDVVSYEYEPNFVENIATTTNTNSFMGYKRSNGKVGIRNEIWIIPTVGCVNSVAVAIANKANQYVKGSVQKIIAYTHPYGCSQMGDDQENTRKILADLSNHPNAGGVLMLGLGCENCGIDTIKPYLGDIDESRIKFLVSQDVEDEVSTAVDLVKELIDNACTIERESCSLDKLIVGLKCGGSDGFSGITANPTVGHFSDILIQNGGTTILTEVPEMFGAETLLLNRCKDLHTFHKTVDLINNFKKYFQEHNQVVYENPSPGNKTGGISTLEDKSLGCTQKSGTSKVVDVLDYGEQVSQVGLNLLYAPGNDLVASTALASSGASIVLFTTGRGTPFASPVPTIKISSNSTLNAKKSNWIDFNTGDILTGTSISEMGEKLFDKVLSVANGEEVKSEQNGYYDMAIFKQGVTL